MSDKINFLHPEDSNPHFVVSALSETYNWGFNTTHVLNAHKYTKGKGIRIAVCDTGLPKHVDLDNNIESYFNATDSVTVYDAHGHQTHTSGIIAAQENGIGVIGYAPEAKLIAIKVLNDDGTSGYEEIERGIRIAIMQKVDFISLSLGSPTPGTQGLHNAIKDATAAGIIIVAAAGNDAGAVNYPAAYDEVIAVAALDKNGNLANFSSRGSEIDFTAPGVQIYSTYLNNQYAMMDGTSQAAPAIVGICALLKSWSMMTPGVNPITNVKEMLQRLSDMTDSRGHVVSNANGTGYGIPTFANMDWTK